MLTVSHLTKTYPNGKRGLIDVGFSIAPGSVTAIIGPSGAGKTTLLRSLNRLLTPETGEIQLGDQEMRQLPPRALRLVRRQIGMIFQDYNLIEPLSALENVLHGCLGRKSLAAGMLGLYTKEEKKQALTLLEEVGLGDYALQKAGSLSGGQKQRVGIARAMMQAPQVILCDEPIASLDPASTHTVMTLLKGLAIQHDLMVIINLHQVDLAREFADHILGVNAGRIVFDDGPAALSDEALTHIYAAPEEAAYG
ncbi:phosphonate ABC transporter ATP-binding protein [Lacticaseibacillus mingshuiensis]|uniref:phosphonate ABC transporter ATP-binding protein n=1 Tax=Lacticaseibacillus mingshuiensis TaxID=2799574 RepID=UPI00194DDC3A|nr:phosphonate ABC transporter ATP-binding protein [Lacticaseibacillus mingshuiensis]